MPSSPVFVDKSAKCVVDQCVTKDYIKHYKEEVQPPPMRSRVSHHLQLISVGYGLVSLEKKEWQISNALLNLSQAIWRLKIWLNHVHHEPLMVMYITTIRYMLLRGQKTQKVEHIVQMNRAPCRYRYTVNWFVKTKKCKAELTHSRFHKVSTIIEQVDDTRDYTKQFYNYRHPFYETTSRNEVNEDKNNRKVA